jgi:hypothetical protein
MSGYDPKATRPPAVDADIDDPAPVDALLDPNIPPAPAAPAPVVIPDSTPEPTPPAPPPTGAPIPSEVPVAPAPDRLTARLAVVGGVAAAAVAAVLLVRRVRRH